MKTYSHISSKTCVAISQVVSGVCRQKFDDSILWDKDKGWSKTYQQNMIQGNFSKASLDYPQKQRVLII